MVRRRFSPAFLSLSAILIPLAGRRVLTQPTLVTPGQNVAAAPTPRWTPRDTQPHDDAEVTETGSHDGGPDVTSPDGGPSVWVAGSTGFEIDESGGFVGQPPPDAACNVTADQWHYDAASRVLTHTGCTSAGQVLDTTVTLTTASGAEVLARVSALQAHGPKTGACGADFPDIVLTILGSGGSRTSYDSDFYSGCQGFDAGGQLFVSYSELGDLMSDLAGYAAACGDAGTVPDAGATCGGSTGDGGGTAGRRRGDGWLTAALRPLGRAPACESRSKIEVAWSRASERHSPHPSGARPGRSSLAGDRSTTRRRMPPWKQSTRPSPTR